MRKIVDIEKFLKDLTDWSIKNADFDMSDIPNEIYNGGNINSTIGEYIKNAYYKKNGKPFEGKCKTVEVNSSMADLSYYNDQGYHFYIDNNKGFISKMTSDNIFYTFSLSKVDKFIDFIKELSTIFNVDLDAKNYIVNVLNDTEKAIKDFINKAGEIGFNIINVYDSFEEFIELANINEMLHIYFRKTKQDCPVSYIAIEKAIENDEQLIYKITVCVYSCFNNNEFNYKSIFETKLEFNRVLDNIIELLNAYDEGKLSDYANELQRCID